MVHTFVAVKGAPDRSNVTCIEINVRSGPITDEDKQAILCN